MGADGGKLLADAIKAHPNYTQIAMNMFDGKADVDMSNKGLDAGDAFIIAAALEKNDQVTGLNPFGNKIPEDVLRTIVVLKAAKIDFSNSGMDKTDVKVLTELLKDNTTVTELDASGNKLGSEGGKAIAASIAENSTITSVSQKQYAFFIYFY